MTRLICICALCIVFLLTTFLTIVTCESTPTPQQQSTHPSILCGHQDIDLSQLQEFLWNHIEVKNVSNQENRGDPKSKNTIIREEYMFSFCQHLGDHKSFKVPACSTSSVCFVRANLSQPNHKEVVAFDGDILHHYIDNIGSQRVEIKSSYNCTENPALTRTVVVEFTCDPNKGLGKPLKAVTQACMTVFRWPTSAVCGIQTRPQVSKCYVYDDRDRERDLTPLMKKGYQVVAPPPESPQDVENIFINVCSEVTDGSCTRLGSFNSIYSNGGVTACVRKGSRNSPINYYGLVSSGSDISYDEESGEVVLKYFYPNNQSTCRTENGSKGVTTVIRFKCPSKSSHHIYGLESRKPFLLQKSDCEMEIEWETEHACPAEHFKEMPHKCIVTGPQGNVVADLRPLNNHSYLLKNITSPVHWSSHYNESHGDFIFNICGPLSNYNDFNAPEYCGSDTSMKSISACRRSPDGKGEIIGTMAGVDMKYADEQLTLIYPNGGECKNSLSHSSYQTAIIFNCNHTATDEIIPKFVSLDECTFFFEVNTSRVCHDHEKDPPVCSVVVYDKNGVEPALLYDLSPLRKKSDELSWKVAVSSKVSPHAVFPPNASMFINVCGPITKTTRIRSCPNAPSTSSVCSSVSPRHGIDIWGDFSSPPSAIPFSSDISVRTKTSGIQHNLLLIYSHREGDHEVRTEITFECKPGIFDSAPVLVNYTNFKDERKVNTTVLRLKWQNGAACPITKITGTHCQIEDKNLGYMMDLNRLYNKTNYVIKRGKYTYYLNVCGSLRDAPLGCQGENVSMCQVDVEQKPKFNESGYQGPWIIGRRNDNLTYFNGVLNMRMSNGTPYNDPNRTPRSGDIVFVCDEEGDGKLEMISEQDRTYWFRMYTKEACPHVEKVVPCLWDNGTHSVDLGMLSLLSNNHVDVKFTKPNESHIYYLNICRPLSALYPNYCPSGAAACKVVMKHDQEHVATKLGYPIGPPTLLPGEENLSLTYINGDPCPHNTSLRTSTKITFVCKEDEGDGHPDLKNYDESTCLYEFNFPTQFVCDVFPEAPAKNTSSKISPVEPVTHMSSFVIGAGTLIVMLLLGFTIILIIVLNAETRNSLATRIRNMVCGNVITANPIHYSQVPMESRTQLVPLKELTTNDIGGDQVSFISVGSSASPSPYNATTMSLKNPPLPPHEGSSSFSSAFKQFGMTRKESEDRIPFSTFDDSNVDLLT